MKVKLRRLLALSISSALCWTHVGMAHAQSVAPPDRVAQVPVAADYASMPFVTFPVLSPNDEWMAGLFGIAGERQLCMISLFGTLADRQCVGMPDMTDVFAIEWVGNDNVVARLSQATKAGDGTSMKFSRLIGFNRLTGQYTTPLHNVMGQNASDVLWVARDGSPMILVAAQQSMFNETVDRFRGNDNSREALFWPAVFRVNVATGEVQKVQGGIEYVLDWRADAAGRLRMAVAYRDDIGLTGAFYRGEKEDLMHSLKSPRDGKAMALPEIFLPGGDHAIVIRNAKDGSALWEVDLNSGADVAKVYEAPPGRTIADVLANADRTALIGVSLSGGRDEIVWLDKDLAELQANLQKAVGERRASILSMSDDRQRLLVRLDRADSPGSLFMFDCASGKLHALANMMDRLGNGPLNPVRAVRYKARDGLEIEAILTLPKGREAKNMPFVVMPHGGPWAHDTLDFDYWAQFVASLGYGVIQPNFRGSDGYGEDFLKKGEGQMGLAMQDDLNDALGFAVKEGWADGKRACLMGGSYGGYATMWGLARDPDLWRCGISVAGVSNLRRDVNDMRSYLNSRTYQADWKKMTPDFNAVSPIKAVARIKAPLLLVHGKKDVRVDFQQSSDMASKMEGAGKVVQFLPLPKADHNFSREADRLELLKATEAFLRKYNPPD